MRLLLYAINVSKSSSLCLRRQTNSSAPQTRTNASIRNVDGSHCGAFPSTFIVVESDTYMKVTSCPLPTSILTFSQVEIRWLGDVVLCIPHAAH